MRALLPAWPEALQDSVLLDPLAEEENNHFVPSEVTGAASAGPGPQAEVETWLKLIRLHYYGVEAGGLFGPRRHIRPHNPVFTLLCTFPPPKKPPQINLRCLLLHKSQTQTVLP